MPVSVDRAPADWAPGVGVDAGFGATFDAGAGAGAAGTAGVWAAAGVGVDGELLDEEPAGADLGFILPSAVAGPDFSRSAQHRLSVSCKQ